MLSEAYLAIVDVLAAAALVVAGYAGIWACNRIVSIFRSDGGFSDAGRTKADIAREKAMDRLGMYDGGKYGGHYVRPKYRGGF